MGVEPEQVGSYVNGNLYPKCSTGGGGATHIATVTGVLSSLSENTSGILIVAGGGGGGSGAGWSGGGIGGGLSGGSVTDQTSTRFEFGGTQNSGYDFGIGASGVQANSGAASGGGRRRVVWRKNNRKSCLCICRRRRIRIYKSKTNQCLYYSRSRKYYKRIC